ncbi:MAG TPA: hypothetical protein VMJ12_05135 [Candidatus Acidoferrales bacterium]|nr:hypothetical protein [Candidatus Acidoferrales bacterium]
MNRSILIVICDFLLLSLLTFSTDINHMADDNSSPPTKVVISPAPVANPGNDLTAVMKQALEEERHNQQQLQQQLADARNATGQREQENRQLQQQVAAARSNIQNLNQQLKSSSEQAQQKLEATQAEAQRQAEQVAALRMQLDKLAQTSQLAQSEKQQLSNQLQLAEVQAHAAAERATLMQQEVQVQQTENARLADSFKSLATNSVQLAQEIRSSTPLAPNTIFSDFVSNRVEAGISAWRTSMFSMDTTRDKQTATVLVTDGTNYFALCHVQDTPVTLWDPGTDWDKLAGTLSWGGRQVSLRSMSFDAQDPRVVMMPVSRADAQKLGCKVYRLSSDPYKFQDAVLVGADEEYYGQCNFQIEMNTPQYVKLDRSLLKGLFGKFNPSRGDLVFSRAGELLGIMVNNTYCLTIHHFAPAATFAFGQDLRNRHTGDTLSQLYGYVFQLPLRLQ